MSSSLQSLNQHVLSFQELTNVDLQRFIKHYFPEDKVDLYHGAYAKEQFTTMVPKEGYYIINLGSLENGGTHWTVLLLCPSSHKYHAIYQDSFGAPPPVEIEHFMHGYYMQHRRPSVNGEDEEPGYELLLNDYILQNPHSAMCGYYCLFFIYYVSPTTTPRELEKIYDEFSEDSKSNDHIIQIFIQSLLHAYAHTS